MALKAILASLDGLSDDLKAVYKKVDDKFVLDVDGMVQKEKIDEFRSTNLSLVDQVKALQKQLEDFKGIDPIKYKELQDKMSTLEEKKLLQDGKIDDVFNMRTARMKQEFEEQLKAKDTALKALEDEKKKAFTQRDQYIIDAELRRSVDNPEFGFQSGVADLLKPQVLSEFTYRDNKVVRVKPDGSVVYGKGGDPASLTEFLQDIVKERPYLIKPSNGSGARPGGGKGGAAGEKTMKRSDFEAAEPKTKMDFVQAGGKVID